MKVGFDEIDAAIMTLCPRENDTIELYCNSIRNVLARAKADIIGKDTAKKFKNYLVKYEDSYDWFTVDIIYSVLNSIYDCTSEDGEDLTLFDMQARALARIKHFEETIDATEAYYKHKNCSNRVVGYNNKEVDNSPSTDNIAAKYTQPYMNDYWYRY